MKCLFQDDGSLGTVLDTALAVDTIVGVDDLGFFFFYNEAFRRANVSAGAAAVAFL